MRSALPVDATYSNPVSYHFPIYTVSVMLIEQLQLCDLPKHRIYPVLLAVSDAGFRRKHRLQHLQSTTITFVAWCRPCP
jgi:hypothetical protein